MTNRLLAMTNGLSAMTNRLSDMTNRLSAMTSRLSVWNTITVSMIVSTTIPLHHNPLGVDVVGNAVSELYLTMCLVVWWLSPLASR